MPAPVAVGSMIIEGARATLRISGDGHMFMTRPGSDEEELSFVPETAGYKGDSVFATQQHLLECLHTGGPSESDGRDYLKTVALVEECYRIARPTPSTVIARKI